MADVARITIRLVDGKNLPDTIEEWDESGIVDAINELREQLETLARDHTSGVGRPLARFKFNVVVD